MAAIRLSEVLTKEAEQELIDAFRELEASKPSPPDGDGSRSTTGEEALHLGVWSKYSMSPFVSKDTWNQSQRTKRAVERIFRVVHEHAVKPVLAFLDEADPSYTFAARR